MTQAEQDRLKHLCRRVKLGQYVSCKDHQWANALYQREPEAYLDVTRQASQQAVKEYVILQGGRE